MLPAATQPPSRKLAAPINASVASPDAALWRASAVAPERSTSVWNTPDMTMPTPATPTAAATTTRERNRRVRSDDGAGQQQQACADTDECRGHHASVRPDCVLAQSVRYRGQVGPQDMEGDDGDHADQR